MQMYKLANKTDQAALISRFETEQEKKDYLSLRNSILLFKALRKERLREVDLSICGFDKLDVNYKHHCLDQNRQHIIPRP